MEELNLSDRLRLIAGLIKKGSKVADIGSDHGYLHFVCPIRLN